MQDKKNWTKSKGQRCHYSFWKHCSINCKTSVGLTGKQRALLQQRSDVEPREGIHHVDSVVLLKPGIKNYLRVLVINDTDTDINIRKNLFNGHLEYVSSK